MIHTAPPKRILVVDDHPDTAELMAELLQAHGYIAVAAQSGHDALEAVAIFQPDVVLLDLGMPSPDGFTVATILRQQYTKEDLVLIAYSAWADSATRSRTQACGFNHHIGKPASIELLLQTINAT